VGRARSLARGKEGRREKLDEVGTSGLLRWGGIGEKQWVRGGGSGPTVTWRQRWRGGGVADDRRAARPELGCGGHGQRGQRTARPENRGGQAADRWAQMAQCGAAASDSI
jgi:hypothetical protein